MPWYIAHLPVLEMIMSAADAGGRSTERPYVRRGDCGGVAGAETAGVSRGVAALCLVGDGGSGGAVGTLVGILVVGVLNNIMNLKGISSYYQLLVKGFMILIAVIIDMKTKESIAKSGTKKS